MEASPLTTDGGSSSATHSSAAPALTSLHIISREALVLAAARLSALRRSLGSNLVARRGCFLRGGRRLGPSVFISGPGRLWAGGQRDPAKHQLLAAFSTDIRRVGRIYATASSR